MKENKTQLPKIYIVLRIIGFVMLAAGITLIILGLVRRAPSMGEAGWFDAERAKMLTIFWGVACLMFGAFITAISFATSIKKVQIQTHRHILNENKQDLMDIAETAGDVISPAITKTIISAREGLEQTEFCRYCGKKIPQDSNFCPKCGKKM